MLPIAARVAALPWNACQDSSGTGNNPLEIGELDVSNGPVSGHNLAAISGRNMASLCHEQSVSNSNLSGFKEKRRGQAPPPYEFSGVNSAVKISGSVSMYNASSLMYFRNRAE